MNPEQQIKKPVHTRTITCTAFVRDDSLVDVEGTLLDIKHQPFVLAERGVVAAGEAIHEMKFVLTIDHDFVIRDAKAVTLQSPFKICSAINESYRQLIGLRIEPGFTRQVKQLFKGVAGCQHLTELLSPMVATAFQVKWAAKDNYIDKNSDDNSINQTTPLDGCHALRQDGEVVKLHFPKYYLKSNH